MKFLIDENIPYNIAKYIRNKFTYSIIVENSEMSGKRDEYLYKFSKENNLTIITLDKDFSNLILYPLENTKGRIILRYKNLLISEIFNKTKKLLLALIDRNINIEEKIVIATNSKIRIRSK